MSFLLDTDTCSASFNQVARVFNRFIQYSGCLYLSTVTLGELYTWACRYNRPPARFQAIHELLKDVTLLEVDYTVARQLGETRAYLLDTGKPMPVADLFIAATALVHGLTLVTHNTRDFRNVPGLQPADWLVP